MGSSQIETDSQIESSLSLAVVGRATLGHAADNGNDDGGKQKKTGLLRGPVLRINQEICFWVFLVFETAYGYNKDTVFTSVGICPCTNKDHEKRRRFHSGGIYLVG